MAERCIWEVMQDLRCSNETVNEHSLCEDHLEEALKEYTSLCSFLLICDEEGQVSPSDENQFQYFYDLLDGEGIEVEDYYQEVQSIYENYSYKQAAKMVGTIEEEFLSKNLPNYEAAY